MKRNQLRSSSKKWKKIWMTFNVYLNVCHSQAEAICFRDGASYDLFDSHRLYMFGLISSLSTACCLCLTLPVSVHLPKPCQVMVILLGGTDSGAQLTKQGAAGYLYMHECDVQHRTATREVFYRLLILIIGEYFSTITEHCKESMKFCDRITSKS